MGSFTAPNLWLLAKCRRMWFDWRVGCSVAPTHSHFLRHEERAELDTSHPDESWWRAELQMVPSTRKKPARGPAFFCCLVGDTGFEPLTSTV